MVKYGLPMKWGGYDTETHLHTSDGWKRTYIAPTLLLALNELVEEGWEFVAGVQYSNSVGWWGG